MTQQAQQENKHQALDDFIKTLDLAYGATFIPQSKSRNAGNKDASINWSICLSPNSGKNPIQRQLVTDYMQGIGHIPNYQKLIPFGTRRTLAHEQVEKLASEKGKVARDLDASEIMAKPLPKPALRDILYSLVMDSDVIDYSSFEDWASNLGYDVDSRAAEKIYNQCLQIGLKLRQLIGDKALQALKDLFQDY